MHAFPLVTLAATASAVLLSACAGMSSSSSTAMAMPMAAPFTQDSLPDPVKVPAGHTVAMETIGVGEITYECRPKAGTPMAFEWVFVGPQADLKSRTGTKVGTYYGPPATWAASDGSKITGAQLAVAPAGTGNIPLQLVKANPAMGSGAMTGIAYIQRVATKGGVAPALPCTSDGLGRKETVKYQADYVFWKAA
jgi:hypothetical protein